MRRRLLVMLAIGLVVIACDSPSGPPAATAAATAPGGRGVRRRWPDQDAPAGTEAYEAIAQMTNGTTQVLTTEVRRRDIE